jgi:hypothetical protein
VQLLKASINHIRNNHEAEVDIGSIGLGRENIGSIGKKEEE